MGIHGGGVPPAPGGGTTDHGLLTGLADDDHTIYAKKASNLSDLTDKAAARGPSGLNLGTAATTAATAYATSTQGANADAHAANVTTAHGLTIANVETTAGSQAKVDTHTSDAVAAHAATAIAFTPAGSIAATTVQAAIEEVALDAGGGGGGGASASGVVGPPTSSAHTLGQMYYDTEGTLWICTVAGTPGSFKSSASPFVMTWTFPGLLSSYGSSPIAMPANLDFPTRGTYRVLRAFARAGTYPSGGTLDFVITKNGATLSTPLTFSIADSNSRSVTQAAAAGLTFTGISDAATSGDYVGFTVAYPDDEGQVSGGDVTVTVMFDRVG